ncbi:hypothetical protein SAMN06265222_12925 [Neorhodopirellula lusitana]|uniref:Uncharacterized protein n=1 Tax=Neorhodopirellula lusitana TaxID=445327 RepID=A0ABY1QUK6_9BACT|nr:hypothetical protein [Neorhodopirellula lusitana]SMP79153.1 hypothetical protein SAMN06265222_12925 [Neorhodopirellula lusitana]
MNRLPPESYDAWLVLSEPEQEHIKDNLWDAYNRDRIDIPFTALARLISTSDRTIIDGAIGTYHGGEYLLHVYVPEDSLASCPKPLEQRFEGFRVYWMCYSHPEDHYSHDIDVSNLKLDILDNTISVNAKRVDLRMYVDAFDSNGRPLIVTHPRLYDGGFSFDLPGFNRFADDTHILLPDGSGGWIHQFTVRQPTVAESER